MGFVALGVPAAMAVVACSLMDLSDFSSGGTVDAAEAGTNEPPSSDATAPSSDAPADGDGVDSDAYGAEVRADQPVTWYRFEEPAGSVVARDEMGARDATLTQGKFVFGAEGIVRRGLVADGTGVLELGDSFDFPGKSAFTVELWVKSAATGSDQRLVNKRGGTPPRGYIFYLDDNASPHFEYWGEGLSLSAWGDGPLPAAFAHVVLTVTYADGKGNAKLWIDAAPQAKGGFDSLGDAPDTTFPLELLERFQGTVDELAIYDKALPPARIAAHYQAAKQ